MSDDIVEGALVRRSSVLLEPVMDVTTALARMARLQEFCSKYLEESHDGGADGGDYGTIPGAGKKKVLFKSGGDKLCDVYALADTYIILSKIEDFDAGLFDYTLECRLLSKVDDSLVGSGLGSCSSYEAKYRWRDGGRTCPQCHVVGTIIKGKEQYGGGWVCWKKKGGCDAKFADNDPAIIGQPVAQRVENPDIIDTKNTVLKMAKKRAKLDAVIGVTRSSGIFTQDLEEGHDADEAMPVGSGSTPAAAAASGSAPAGETHAEKIARIKREAAQTKGGAPAQTATTSAPVASPAAQAPSTNGTPVQTPPPAGTTAPVAKAAESVPGPAGSVKIEAINTSLGPMVMKDQKMQPAWGPLYVITFSGKVQAPGGVMVNEVTTFDEDLAKLADKLKEQAAFVVPKVELGKKKGTYNVTAFDVPAVA